MPTAEATPCWILPSLVSDDPHFPTRQAAERAAPDWGARSETRQLPTACVDAACGGCDEVYDQDAESITMHFPSRSAAVKDVTASGWSVAEDGSLRCRQCTLHD